MKTYYWLIKREFWENRGSFLWAPVIASSVFLLLNIMALITFEVLAARHNIRLSGLNLDQLVQSFSQKNMADAGALLDVSLMSATGLLSFVLAVVVFFYCLGSLYDDRKDRSILFWKSLPISDTNTVLSKALSAGVVAPVISTLCSMIAGVVMLLVLIVFASIHGVHLWNLLSHTHPFRTLFTMIANIPVNLVWALPSIGWLMLCSSWARSKPFLWALVIPIGVGIMISWFGAMGLFNVSDGWFWKNVILRPLYGVLPNSWIFNSDLLQMAKHTGNVNLNLGTVLQHFSGVGAAWSQLTRPDFIIGAVVGLAMIGASIWFRGRRDDS